MDPGDQPSQPDGQHAEQQAPEPHPDPVLPPAEQMRARRLAKLQAQSNQTPSSPPVPADKENSKSPTPSDVPLRSKITINGTPAQSPQVGASRASAPSRKTDKGTDTVGLAAERPAIESPPAKKGYVEPIEEWTNHTLSSIFRISVHPACTKDRQGNALTFLSGLNGDLEEQGQPLNLTTDNLDQAMNEAGAAFNAARPLMDYFLPVWKNIVRTCKTAKDARPERPERIAVLHEARRLCMSNAIFALTMPEYFGREPNPEHDTIAPYLLRPFGNEDSICMDFIEEAADRFADDEDGQIKGIFVNAMVEISNRLSSMTMNDEFGKSVAALRLYCNSSRAKLLLNALANHPTFQMATSAANVEKMTLLGPFFRISPLQLEVTQIYFAGARSLDRAHIANAQHALQSTLKNHLDNLYGIVMAFARAGDYPKSRLLDWLAYTMNTNHKRRAIQVDPKEVATDGFMMNVSFILDRLCEPFIDSNFSKIDKIDIDYLRRSPRLNITDETKLDADQAQANEFYSRKVDGTSNFISEVFFLNMAGHHYGSGAAKQRRKDMDRELKYLEGECAKLEAQRDAARGRPNVIPVLEAHIATFHKAIDRHYATKHALEGVLTEELSQTRALTFMRCVSVWLLRVASQTDYKPDKELQLPLSMDKPAAFSCLPEYVLQNVVDNFKFVFRNVPRILVSALGEEMIALCLAFLESSEYIRNPSLKSSLVSMLYSGTWQIYHMRNGVLGDALTQSKFANKHLLHALMKFYIECELAGAQSAFYDKFNIRYEIFQVIKCVWPNDFYKQQLGQQSRVNTSFFVQFVNMLLNDATYVLDEALSKFPKIHDLQHQLDTNEPPLNAEERTARESELSQTEGQAQSYMQLANETVSMMKLFTDALSSSFTMPEIVSRLAGMLDFNIVTLAGPKSRNLKVKNPEKYHFAPKTLLPQLVDIYLNLGGRPAFVDAVAADGRSFKPEVFADTSRILASRALISPDRLDEWNALCAKFVSAKEANDQAELDYGEVPADFEDPIMGDLMKDPVILPSKHIVDRSTIVQHLLSDPKDPFTRQPMTVDDAIPAVELKERIEAWKKERIEAARVKASEAMDTTEG